MRSSNFKGNVVGNNIDGPVENGISQKERLPTIQIDTVPSPPWSPAELSPVTENAEEPIHTGDIDIQLQDQDNEQQPGGYLGYNSDELRESLRSYVEDLLSEAMGVAEKRLQFVGVDDDEDEEEADEEAAAGGEDVQRIEEKEEEIDEKEIRAAAEKVVEEVLSKATDTVAEQMQRDISDLQFPISFDEAPDDVKDAASNLVKEIVGKAVAMAEEKAAPTTVPFSFEDVDLIKTSGPWYVRVREALLRVLRSACFCTPRRDDS